MSGSKKRDRDALSKAIHRVNAMTEEEKVARGKKIAEGKSAYERDMAIVAQLAAEELPPYASDEEYQEFFNKAMLEIVRRQEVQEKKYHAREAIFKEFLAKYELLADTLESTLNELAVRDIIKAQELREKKEGLSARLQAIKDNEIERNRKPAFKAGATHTPDGDPINPITGEVMTDFLGSGRNIFETAPDTRPLWVTQDQSTEASLRMRKGKKKEMMRVRYKSTGLSLVCPSSLGKNRLPGRPHAFLGMVWSAEKGYEGGFLTQTSTR